MDYPKPFSPEEHRFVLAEVIKTTSKVDPVALAHFLASQGVLPITSEQCMGMQMPSPARTGRDCMLATKQLLSQAPSKRKASLDHTNGPSKRPNSQGSLHNIANSGPVRIAPRPGNGAQTTPRPSPPVQQQPTLPKKRGRPSRADKAKRDLKPQLPPTIAPRPPRPVPNSYDPGHNLPQLAPRDPRFSMARHSISAVPPMSPHAYQPFDMTRPRVLSDGVVERPETAHAYLKGSELAPLEPHVRILGPPSPHKSPTILPPLVPRGSPSSPRSSRSAHTGSMLN